MIIVAKSSGFCGGVKKAISEATKSPIGTRCVIGNLVHNNSVINRVKNLGIEFVTEPDSSFNEVVISAHGISAKVIKKLSGYKVIDTTCINVKKIIDIAKSVENNSCLVMIGDENHSEVKNVVSYADNYVILNKNKVEESEIQKVLNFDFTDFKVVFQTTVSTEIFNKYRTVFSNVNDNRVLLFDTICPAVQKRIDESKDIAKNTDLMVVVGDSISANCTLLYKECLKVNPNTIFVSCKNDLPTAFPESVGVTAGASVDPEDLDKIVHRIQELLNN